MARNPDKDILQNPAPTSGAAKKTVDAVLTALKIGNGLVSVLSGLLASVLILYSSYVLYDSFATEYGAYTSSWDLLKYKPAVMEAEPSDGAETLAAINDDYRAWLTVYDTTIDYPVVQGSNDLYYASHDVYGDSSLTGAIYLAALNNGDFSDSYNLLYGHHMDNGAMFGSLDRFLDSAYLHAHQTGIVVTKSGIYDVTFFAAAKTDAYEKQIYTVGNRANEVISFLTGSRDHDAGIGTEVVIYDTEAAKGATKVIALSTCADAETNGRLVVFGRMTPHEVVTPTPEPTDTPEPTAEPTATAAPSAGPTETPTETVTPTEAPTSTPTATPTASPTRKPTVSTNTATPSPIPTVTLTVHYLEDGTEVFPTVVFTHAPGDTYYVVSPQYPGYNMDIEIVQGTITEDMVIYVHYVPKTYRLTIRYAFMDGTEAAGAYMANVHTGETYDVASPVIDGYTALRLSVSGTNPGRDEQYTVIYIPGTPDNLITLEDYETAIGLESTFVQVGICFE